jgi:hypothetical protein
MLDDTRRLLEQLKLADGMRAIAIQLGEQQIQFILSSHFRSFVLAKVREPFYLSCKNQYYPPLLTLFYAAALLSPFCFSSQTASKFLFSLSSEEDKEEEHQTGNDDANKEGAQQLFTHSPRLLMLTRSAATQLPINLDPVRIKLEMLVSTRVLPTAVAPFIAAGTTTRILLPRPEIDLTPLLSHQGQLHSSALLQSVHHAQQPFISAAGDDAFFSVPTQQPLMLEYLDRQQQQRGHALAHSFIPPLPFPLLHPPPPFMPYNNETILPAWPFPPPSLPFSGPLPALGPCLPPPPPSIFNNHGHPVPPFPKLPFGHPPMHPFEQIPHLPSHPHQIISPYLDSPPMTSFSASGTFASSSSSPLMQEVGQTPYMHGRNHSNSASSVITAATSVHEEDLGNTHIMDLALSTAESDKTVVNNTNKLIANQRDEEEPRQPEQGREMYLPLHKEPSSFLSELRNSKTLFNKQDDKVKVEIQKAISGNFSSSSSFQHTTNRTFSHHQEQKSLNLITNGRSGQPGIEQRIHGGSSRSLVQPETRCAPPVGIVSFSRSPVTVGSRVEL